MYMSMSMYMKAVATAGLGIKAYTASVVELESQLHATVLYM